MGKYDLIKWVGKGVGSVVLAVAAALFAAYALREFSGWAFALAFVLAIACSMPMVLFFNLFSDPNKLAKKNARFVRMHEEDPTPWSELFESNRTDTNNDD